MLLSCKSIVHINIFSKSSLVIIPSGVPLWDLLIRLPLRGGSVLDAIFLYPQGVCCSLARLILLVRGSINLLPFVLFVRPEDNPLWPTLHWLHALLIHINILTNITISGFYNKTKQTKTKTSYKDFKCIKLWNHLEFNLDLLKTCL